MDHMKPGSSIINTSSVNAYTPMPDVRPLLTSLHTGPHVEFGQHAQAQAQCSCDAATAAIALTRFCTVARCYADPGLLGDQGRHRYLDEGTRPEAAGRERHPRQLGGSGSGLVRQSARFATITCVGSDGRSLSGILVADGCHVDGHRTPLIPASFPGKMVTTFGADMTPIKRAAQPREVPTCVYAMVTSCSQPEQSA
jgi:hypothetical protein